MCTARGHRSRDCSREISCTVKEDKRRLYATPHGVSLKALKLSMACPPTVQKCSDLTQDNEVLLETFKSSIVSTNQPSLFRGFIDECSQRTFIRENISRNVLPILRETVVQLNTFGDHFCGAAIQR